VRNHSLDAVQWMEATGKVVCERSKGRIVACTYRPDAFDKHSKVNPIRQSISTGTYYSFEEFIGDQYYVWSHRDLIKADELAEIVGNQIETKEDLTKFLRTIFNAVQVSCMVRDERRELTKAPSTRMALQCSIGNERTHELRRRAEKQKPAHTEKPLQRNWTAPKPKTAPVVASPVAVPSVQDSVQETRKAPVLMFKRPAPKPVVRPSFEMPEQKAA
jgi:hypothetical protein